MKLVENADRDPSQAAPAFCGIATDEQNKAMLSSLKVDVRANAEEWRAARVVGR